MPLGKGSDEVGELYFSLLVYNSLNCVRVVPKGKSLTINKNASTSYVTTATSWSSTSTSSEVRLPISPALSIISDLPLPRLGQRSPHRRGAGAPFMTRGAPLKMALLPFPHGRRKRVVALQQRLRPHGRACGVTSGFSSLWSWARAVREVTFVPNSSEPW